MLIHECDEAVGMMALNEMDQFVDDDVFEALHRFLGQFEVQPDATGDWIAGAPPSFHFPDTPSCDLNTQRYLPFLQKRRNQFP